MSFVAGLIDRLFPARRGKLCCQCGAVQLQLTVPASSYMLLEQTTALCHCSDCLGFCRRLKNGDAVLTENHASQLVQFYKSDITVAKGEQHIESVKLHSDNTPMARCFCRLCETPLGADIVVAPVTLLYHGLLGDYNIFLPTLVLNFASAPSSVRPYSRHTTVRRGLAAPWFFFRVVARVILGFIFQKGSGGLLENQYDAIPVGMKTKSQ